MSSYCTLHNVIQVSNKGKPSFLIPATTVVTLWAVQQNVCVFKKLFLYNKRHYMVANRKDLG